MSLEAPRRRESPSFSRLLPSSPETGGRVGVCEWGLRKEQLKEALLPVPKVQTGGGAAAERTKGHNWHLRSDAV